MSEQSETPADAVDLLRAWLVGDELECEVRPAVFDDPAVWGNVLADIARHVAYGLQQEESRDPGDTLRVILETFKEELSDTPRDTP